MLREELENYIKRTADIRYLSAPGFDEIDSPGEYSKVLYHNFEKIGEYASENRKFLNEILYPLCQSQELLSDEEIQALEAIQNKEKVV